MLVRHVRIETQPYVTFLLKVFLHYGLSSLSFFLKEMPKSLKIGLYSIFPTISKDQATKECERKKSQEKIFLNRLSAEHLKK